jgi:hypothetical protein
MASPQQQGTWTAAALATTSMCPYCSCSCSVRYCMQLLQDSGYCQSHLELCRHLTTLLLWLCCAAPNC